MLLLILFAAFAYSKLSDRYEIVSAAGQKIHVSDGDSFAIGKRRFRLHDIDAPEFAQNCAINGVTWACGKAAKASLEKLLLKPGLNCAAEAEDQFGRSVATCAVTGIKDIGAEQVRTGMAVSHEYMTMRSYGDEEDEAKAAKRGIWQGEFQTPVDWRTAHPR